jgi:hypothetical protein
MLTRITVHVESYVDGKLIYTEQNMSFELENALAKDYTQALDILAGRNVNQLIRRTIDQHTAKLTPLPALPPPPDTKPKEATSETTDTKTVPAVPPAAAAQPVPPPGNAVPAVPAGPPPNVGVQPVPAAAGPGQAQQG